MLRGAGRHATTLYLPYSLMDLYGARKARGGEGERLDRTAARMGGALHALAVAACRGAWPGGRRLSSISLSSFADKKKLSCTAAWHSGRLKSAGPTNKTNNGFYVWTGAFITAKGGVRAIRVANVTAPAARGTHGLQVDDASGLWEGEVITLVISGGDGALSKEL